MTTPTKKPHVIVRPAHNIWSVITSAVNNIGTILLSIVVCTTLVSCVGDPDIIDGLVHILMK